MKNYTDIEQSRKLAEILPIESADMFYADLFVDNKHKYIVHPLESYGFKTFKDTNERTSQRLNFIPCWSLAALLGVLPKEIVYNKNIVYLEFHVWQNSLEYVNNADYILHITRSYDNPVDTCVAMIEKLHELKML